MAHQLVALVLCDAVATSPEGKFTLYGLFDVIHSKELPARHPQFSVFWKLISDELGKVTIRIEKPDGSSLFDSPAYDLTKNPLGKHQGILALGGVEFPVAGNYRVIVLFNDTEELGSAMLTIEKVQTTH